MPTQDKWHVLSLEIDKPSIEVADKLYELWPDDVHVIKTRPCVDLSAKHSWLVRILEDVILPLPAGNVVTTYGSGYYHHITSGLLSIVADPKSKEYCYVHIDQHGDNDDVEQLWIDCANFVSEIPCVTNATKIKHIGTLSMAPKIECKDHVSSWLIKQEGVVPTLEKLFVDAPQDTYISIDLDVLRAHEMHTDFPGGEMPLKQLLNILAVLKTTRNIIGADILGLSYRYHHPSYYLFQKSKLVYAMVAGILVGKDITPLETAYNKLTEESIAERYRFM